MKRISPSIIILLLFFSYSVKADWLMDYYIYPTPDLFVSEVNNLSKSGVLSDPKHKQAISVFLSRVLADNSDKTLKWMKELKHLNKADMEPVFYAVWLSDTKESKEYLKSIGATQALETKPTNFLQVPIDGPNTLDALWAYFFATGQKEPIRKIVSALNYENHSGALEAYKKSKQTEQDKQNAILDSIFKSARWSLESNIKQRPRVAEICGDIFKDKSLTNSEQLWLGVVLSKALPNKYKMSQTEPGQWAVQTLN
jgi:hypothetical protein